MRRFETATGAAFLVCVASSVASAQPRTFDSFAGETLAGGFDGATRVVAVRGTDQLAIAVGGDLGAARRNRELLARAGLPVTEVVGFGTLQGESALLVRRYPGAVRAGPLQGPNAERLQRGLLQLFGQGYAVTLGPIYQLPDGQFRIDGGSVTRRTAIGLDEEAEKGLLRPGKKAALHPVYGAVDRRKDPLVLVHGIKGSPKDLAGVIERFGREYEVFVLAYDDFKTRTGENGLQFADELRRLVTVVGEGRRLGIVAHSLGGIVTRQALNDLTLRGGVEKFGAVRFVSVDSPWHGYAGPSDRGFGGFMMKVAKLFMPDGLEDMRAKSELFRGTKNTPGLLDVALPHHVTVECVFARSGDEVKDWTELKDFTAQVTRFYREGRKIEGQQEENYWKALQASRTHVSFDSFVRAHREPTEAVVRSGLEKFWRRFEGDHTSVLANEELLRHVGVELRR